MRFEIEEPELEVSLLLDDKRLLAFIVPDALTRLVIDCEETPASIVLGEPVRLVDELVVADKLVIDEPELTMVVEALPMNALDSSENSADETT